MGKMKLDFESSSCRRDFPVPDDWTTEQYGPDDDSFDIRRTTCRSRASSALVLIKGTSQDFVIAKKYGMFDFTTNV